MLEQQKVQLEDKLAVYDKYRSLWRAVVLQALLDIKTSSDDNITIVNKSRAITWIDLDKKDFLDVCQRAELSPRKIYETKVRLLGKQNDYDQKLHKDQ